MKDGLYTIDYTHGENRYSRKVLVEGGYYRFVDDKGLPLHDSMSLRVDIAISSDAQAVFVPIEDPDAHDGPAGLPAKLPPRQPVGGSDAKPVNRLKIANERLGRVVAAVCSGSTEGLCHG